MLRQTRRAGAPRRGPSIFVQRGKNCRPMWTSRSSAAASRDWPLPPGCGASHRRKPSRCSNPASSAPGRAGTPAGWRWRKPPPATCPAWATCSPASPIRCASCAWTAICTLPGVWELARHDPLPHSPIAWNDSGDLRAVAEVPGGTINPGKMVSGLARAAEQRGALIFEYTRVEHVEFGETRAAENRRPRASRAASAFRLQRAIARNQRAWPASPIRSSRWPRRRRHSRRRNWPSSDLPRASRSTPWRCRICGDACCPDGGIIFGAGLVHLKDWRELASLDVAQGQPAEMFARFEQRVPKVSSRAARRAIHASLGRADSGGCGMGHAPDLPAASCKPARAGAGSVQRARRRAFGVPGTLGRGSIAGPERIARVGRRRIANLLSLTWEDYGRRDRPSRASSCRWHHRAPPAAPSPRVLGINLQDFQVTGTRAPRQLHLLV